MSSDPANLAISVQSLSKRYRIASRGDAPQSLAEVIAQKFRHPLRSGRRQDFDALTDVSFDVQVGETLGVIGRNGAGKSTLLKIISRIVQPSTGAIDLYGKVGSLLEVGTGFHAELTGRENVFLNGAILGMSKKAIRQQFDSIVEFADIGPFLDTPVKRYSSGMYVRLAFAVAAHLNPDILIVDEVLAVGDVQFQNKCLGKMSEVTSQQGRTVMFVSHNMVSVESLCSRCVLLEAGRIVFDGDTRTAIRRYLAGSTVGVPEAVGVYDLAGESQHGSVGNGGSSSRSGPILRRLTVRGVEGNATSSIVMGEGLSLTIDVQDLSLAQMVSIRIKTDDDLVIAGVHSQLRPLNVIDSNQRPDVVMIDFPSLPLMPGRYWIEVAVSEGRKGNSPVETVERAAPLDVLPSNMFGSGWQVQRGQRFGLVLVDPRWELRSAGKIIAASEHGVISSI